MNEAMISYSPNTTGEGSLFLRGWPHRFDDVGTNVRTAVTSSPDITSSDLVPLFTLTQGNELREQCRCEERSRCSMTCESAQRDVIAEACSTNKEQMPAYLFVPYSFSLIWTSYWHKNKKIHVMSWFAVIHLKPYIKQKTAQWQDSC